jgi:hypothetical protein
MGGIGIFAVSYARMHLECSWEIFIILPESASLSDTDRRVHKLFLHDNAEMLREAQQMILL